MNKIAKFHRISPDNYNACMLNTDKAISDYDLDIANVKLPRRSTAGSAGYDFYSPVKAVLEPKSDVVIPTGIRCEIETGWFLAVVPRSGLGFKYGISLANTVGIIDSDYFFADNEGHIMVKLHNPSNEKITINIGDKFCQSIFIPYGITIDDDATDTRTGGFGSTGK